MGFGPNWRFVAYYYGIMFDFGVKPQVMSTDCDRHKLITLIAGVCLHQFFDRRSETDRPLLENARLQQANFLSK